MTAVHVHARFAGAGCDEATEIFPEKPQRQGSLGIYSYLVATAGNFQADLLIRCPVMRWPFSWATQTKGFFPAPYMGRKSTSVLFCHHHHQIARPFVANLKKWLQVAPRSLSEFRMECYEEDHHQIAAIPYVVQVLLHARPTER